MSKKRFSGLPFTQTLGFKLLAVLALALLLAVITYRVALDLSYGQVDRICFEEEFQDRQNRHTLAALQQFATDNRLTAADMDRLGAWVSARGRMFLVVFRGGVVLYDSSGSTVSGQLAVAYGEQGTALGEDAVELWNPTYDLQLADGPTRVWMHDYSYERYYTVAYTAALAAGTVVFLAVFLLAIREKTRYINLLERQLAFLEGGALDHPITVRGSDELGRLAGQIEAMRRGLRQRQAGEAAARAANQELITAMSHDLRTPLTALMGYLDILGTDRCPEEDRAMYLEASRRKAYQIKELSDKLFQFFLVYGQQDELQDEPVDCGELLMQTLEEGLLSLEGEGFTVERRTPDPACRLCVDVSLMRRLFDNLISNLSKYADPAHPLGLAWQRRDGWFELTLTNHIRPGPRVESTALGLKTCERILSAHGGEFRAARDEAGQTFTACLRLPCAPVADGGSKR